jgi:hypothetical protein
VEAGLTLDGAHIDRIDWKAPWLAGLKTIAEPILHSADWRSGLNIAARAMALCNHRDLPIRFVPQADLPSGIPYETYISASGCVPTRANLHDFFNALVWLAYPQVKKQLNALQATELIKYAAAQSGSSANTLRGKLRDAATIFDENAALFVSTDTELNAALREHRWHALFMTHRAAFEHTCSVRLFGHALMEKLLTPYKAITAHTWIVAVEPDFFRLPENEQRRQLDTLVGGQLAQGLAASDLTPLPVLGVPGWWAQQDDAYYADQFVFRPRKK